MTPASSTPLLWELSAFLLALALGGLLLFARSMGRMDLRRSVLIHVPLARTWRTARNLPRLLSGHLKIEDHGGIDEWILREGDGDGVGSVWRGVGRWGGSACWIDVELAIARSERQVAIALQRDSLGTHLWLHEHLGSLTLQPAGAEATKVTWRLVARLAGVRPRIERCVRARRLASRLLDLSLRSLKSDLERDFAIETKALLLEEARRPPEHRGASSTPDLPPADPGAGRAGRPRPAPPDPAD